MQRKLLPWSLPLKHLQTLIPHHHHHPFNLHSLRSVKQVATILAEDDLADPSFSPVLNTFPISGTRNSHHNKKKAKIPQSLTNKPNKSNTSRTLDSPTEPPLHSDLPFDFQYSYSETNPSIKPISFREPKFSPFGPGRLDRKWNGWSAPVNSGEVSLERSAFDEWKSGVLGEPLTELEVEELVEKYGHSNCSRQINLGKGGVTHNMLDDIHNHWKKAEAVRIKCLGVPTLDMDNVCFHLEDKTGGKVISQRTNILLLYRGRHYDPKKRPTVPLMLWKPHAPIYPKLVKNVPDGLTFEETKEMRNKGLNSPALVKLTQNGVYVNVVEKVREAFKVEEVLRIDCTYVESNDCKKITVKLRDLVPCVPLLIKNRQIIIWRSKKEQITANQQTQETISQSRPLSQELSPCIFA